ncbi:MAG: PaaI family thioesterase [Pseudomonadota bacterium]
MVTVCGGFAATLLDAVLDIAVQTVPPPATGVTTAELNLNFTRVVLPSMGRLVATGEVVHHGKTMITVEGRLEGAGDDRLHANATATCFVLQIV